MQRHLSTSTPLKSSSQTQEIIQSAPSQDSSNIMNEWSHYNSNINWPYGWPPLYTVVSNDPADAFGGNDRLLESPFSFTPPTAINNFISGPPVRPNVPQLPAAHLAEQQNQQYVVQEQYPALMSEGPEAEYDMEAGDEENGEDGASRDAQNSPGNYSAVPTTNANADPAAQPSHHDPATGLPTRAHPRAATIPRMTPGRKRCDTCYNAHVSIIFT